MAVNGKIMIAQALAPLCEMPVEELQLLVEIPPQSELGDYAFPCFTLAKKLRMAPPKIAADLAEKLQGKIPECAEIRQTGGYVNIFLDRPRYMSEFVTSLLEEPESIFPTEDHKDETVLVEFSSPNIAKPFHVGHAFTTILGQSLAKLYARAGYNVVKMNHLGDYGTQFGKLIVAYKKWGDEEALKKEPITELLRIYVLFHQEAEKHPELEEEAREAFKRLEQGCDEEKALWQKFRDWSLEEFKRVYDRLGITFDNYNGESFYSDKIPAVVDMLREKGLLVESEGAQVVELEEEGLPPCIILKSDGTTIYASRDIASILYRDQTWHFHKNIYVVGIPQALHFKQVFSVLKKAGYACADRCVHVGFGLVKFPEGKMSTRSGEVIFLEDLLTEAVQKTAAIIKKNAEERQIEMSEAEQAEIAEAVGLGAVVYTFLRNGRERDIVFSWQDMLNFDGDTAPYLQYTYARTASILRRSGEEAKPEHLLAAVKENLLTEDSEFALCRQLEGLTRAFYQALQANEPSILAKQISAVAHAFNKFYTDCPILKSEGKLREARLALCAVTGSCLRQGLDLLGIRATERM